MFKYCVERGDVKLGAKKETWDFDALLKLTRNSRPARKLDEENTIQIAAKTMENI